MKPLACAGTLRAPVFLPHFISSKNPDQRLLPAIVGLFMSSKKSLSETYLQGLLEIPALSFNARTLQAAYWNELLNHLVPLKVE